MQLDHEKLDVYAVALDFAVWKIARDGSSILHY
jgi:hypothetical protein